MHNINEIRVFAKPGNLFSYRKYYREREVGLKHLSFHGWYKLYFLYEDSEIQNKKKRETLKQEKYHKETRKRYQKPKPILKERNPFLMKIGTKRLLNIYKTRCRGYYGDEYFVSNDLIWIGSISGTKGQKVPMTFTIEEVQNELNNREHVEDFAKKKKG